MITETKERVAIIHLVQKKEALENRIKRLEKDLTAPLSADFNEQAGEISDRNLRAQLLEVERKNLISLNQEIEKRKM